MLFSRQIALAQYPHRSTRSKKIEIIQFVAILHDVALDLAGVDPSHKVLHIAGDQESGIINDLCSNADMTLFDESCGLFVVKS